MPVKFSNKENRLGVSQIWFTGNLKVLGKAAIANSSRFPQFQPPQNF
ncbi:MAG: hypothetical protein MUF49_14620 [Oculatellaceae cyanobacterium Prado106]|nr:hypothetical protein [Oculatellaceae cyanobacterium Prado106]